MAALKAEADDYVERHRGERDEAGTRAGGAQRPCPGAQAHPGNGNRGASRRRGSMIAAVMNKASAGASPAASCRPTCAVRPRSPRCCRSYICADSRPAIFAPRWKGCWARTRPGCRRPTSPDLLPAGSKNTSDFRQRDSAGREYVYVWVDGVHFNIRLEDDRLCTLVMIGARPDGEKELLAVEDGYRESAESWKTLLRDLKRRGMAAPGGGGGRRRAGVLGRGARGVARDPRAGLLVPQAGQRARQAAPAAAAARQARVARDDVRREPRRVRGRHERASRRSIRPSIPRRSSRSLPTGNGSATFFDFPAEHWKHLRTTNVIESPFATVRLRERATRGAGSRTKGLLMAFKLLEMAQLRWRRLDGASCCRWFVPG